LIHWVLGDAPASLSPSLTTNPGRWSGWSPPDRQWSRSHKPIVSVVADQRNPGPHQRAERDERARSGHCGAPRGFQLVSVSASPTLRQVASTSGGGSYQITFDSAHPVSITEARPYPPNSIELDMIAPASSSDNLLGGLTFDTTGLSEIALLGASVLSGDSSVRVGGDALLSGRRRHAYPDAA